MRCWMTRGSATLNDVDIKDKQPVIAEPLIPGGMSDRQASSTDGTGSTDSTSTYSVRTEPVQDVPVRTTESQLHPSQSHLLVGITYQLLKKC